MANKLRIVTAQLNLHVGDISKNLQAHIDAATTARDQHHADVIVFPELSLTGYSPEDLLLRKDFINEARQALQSLNKEISGIHCVVGHPLPEDGKLFNACSLLYNGEILETYAKQRLPNSGVFDECRYFTSQNKACVFDINGIKVGIIICEDAWHVGPIKDAVAAGAQIIIDPNASPFTLDKHELRSEALIKKAKKNNVAIIYVNHISGQDDLVFDGGSMVVTADGEISHFSGFFKEALTSVDITLKNNSIHIEQPSKQDAIPSAIERAYQAIVLGVKDYMGKNNLPGALVGLSGGIDSALTCAIAVDALGSDKVHGVMMPSRYTADISNEDAEILAKNLGITTSNIPIEPSYKSFLDALSTDLKNKKPDVTEENIQARCRCIILMALSNATGKLVLSTGNRSEIAVGYCTLYGDMAGGFAPLKDVPKTMVYELAKYRNQLSAAIPERTITRPPSAELAPDQTDQDSLPPYEELDKILECYLNKGLGISEITSQGFDEKLVTHIIKLIHMSEYKRKQGAVGPRINKTSFIRDWRYPTTHGFKG